MLVMTRMTILWVLVAVSDQIEEVCGWDVCMKVRGEQVDGTSSGDNVDVVAELELTLLDPIHQVYLGWFCSRCCVLCWLFFAFGYGSVSLVWSQCVAAGGWGGRCMIYTGLGRA